MADWGYCLLFPERDAASREVERREFNRDSIATQQVYLACNESATSSTQTLVFFWFGKQHSEVAIAFFAQDLSFRFNDIRFFGH